MQRIDNLFKTGARIRGRHFVLYWKISTAPISQLDFIIPRRFANKAVQRNLIRRQSRSLLQKLSLAKPSIAWDLMLRLTSPLPVLSRRSQYQELSELFTILQEKTNIIR